MATPDAAKVYRVPGRLVINPTDLSAAYPYGGTALGVVHSVRLEPVTREFNIPAEDYGGGLVETLDMGRDWVAAGLVRGWDYDTLAHFFPNVQNLSGGPSWSEPYGAHGQRGTNRAAKLLFAPNDSTHPGWIMYRAIPQIEESARFNWAVIQELTFLGIWRGVPGPSGYTIQFGALENLSL